MAGNSSVSVSTCPARLSSSVITTTRSSSNFLPCLPPRPKAKLTLVRALSADTGHNQLPSSSETKNPLAVVLDVPRKFWRQTLHPLSDFGFGRKSIWEGGASGICTGTPVRIRGVTVGNVIRVNPSLKSIEAVVEVEDCKIIIPQNSLVEVNQSGLLMETLIDITPRDPIPTPSVGPLDPECVKEGIFTWLGREVEEIGVANSYSLAERVFSVIEKAKPLLTKFNPHLHLILMYSHAQVFGIDVVMSKIQAMAEDVQPLLAEVRNSGLLKEVEGLTRNLKQASEDLRVANSSIMTHENTELIQKSIYTLIFTLKNIEFQRHSIRGDVDIVILSSRNKLRNKA
ncbi:hypothetical protein EZV62_024445 [Acer yangbiense]|uniref:Mce/MlaD domain-containing protein n=1 Tax=Acer yangbiense TaxID=1000413 RepID=A0A5C7GVA3_9ROSI|nr:hypothetical protein EZV62_024445 [Acer yangbiense]